MKPLKSALLLMLCSAALLCAQEAAAEKPEPSAIWKWANFAILAGVLGYAMAKHLPPFYRSRTSEIQKGISEAQSLKKDAERRAAEVDARIRTLGADIAQLRTQSGIEMQQEGERISQETIRQVARLEQQAAQEMEAAAKAARRELKIYAAKLALDLAEQRVRVRLNGDTETALVNGFIQDLRNQESRN